MRAHDTPEPGRPVTEAADASNWNSERLLERQQSASSWRALPGEEGQRPALARADESSVRRRLHRAIAVPVGAGAVVFVVAIVIAIAMSVLQQQPAAEESAALTARAAASGGDEAGEEVAGTGEDTTDDHDTGVHDAGTHDPGIRDTGVGGVEAGDAPDAADVEGTADASANDERILVHVVGAVAAPGVVEVRAGSRLADALDAAGGATPGADLTAVNLARPAADGEQLFVPTIEQTASSDAATRWRRGPATAADGGSSGDGGPLDAGSGAEGGHAGSDVVDINRATSEQLQALPRVGPALAQRIIDWRETNGGFQRVEQLLEVSGIGEKTFAGLRERVTV